MRPYHSPAFRDAQRAEALMAIEAAAIDAHLEDFEPSAPACPACIGGDGAYLGRLGTRAHFRCIACGCTFSEAVS